MAQTMEIVFCQHLVLPGSLLTIVQTVMPDDLLPSEALRPMHHFAIDYWHNAAQRGVAPTPEVMRFHFDNLLAEHKIDLDIDPEGELSWALEALRGNYIDRRWQPWVRKFAEQITGADVMAKPTILGEAINDLMMMQSALTSPHEHLDFRFGISPAVDAYLERLSPTRPITGAKFGLGLVDEHIGEVRPGELCVIGGTPKSGKAQPLSTFVLTPSGWVRMGDLRVNDQVIGANGKSVRVTGVYPQGVEDVYALTLDDHTVVEATGEHLWAVWSHRRTTKAGITARERCRVITTLEIQARLDRGNNRDTYLPVVTPVEFEERNVPIDPYIMGLLLGDGGMTSGTTRFTSADDEIVGAIRDAGLDIRKLSYGVHEWSVCGISKTIREMGLRGHLSQAKFIPEDYLWGSVAQRLALLQGLMDTDGTTDAGASFSTTSPWLRDGMIHLVQSLGGSSRATLKKGKRPLARRAAWDVTVKLPYQFVPFRLERKLTEWRRRADRSIRPIPTRRIVAVGLVRREEAQCISVDADDGLYVTSGFVVTHNTAMLLLIAWTCWNLGLVPVIMTMEISVAEVVDRLIAMIKSVDAGTWQRGRITDGDLAEIREFMERMANHDLPFPIIHPEIGQRTVEHLVRKGKAFGDVLLIDQTSFIEPNALSVRLPRYQQIGNSLHELKSLITTGKEIPCFLAHQISREGQKSAEKLGRLEMWHFSEAAEVERTADWAFGMFATDSMRDSHSIYLQLLAARRQRLNAWQLRWQPWAGTMHAQHPVRLDGR